jgi:ADP-ribosylglycohydrolase
MSRARLSLVGLSVGDALGERFFVSSETVESLIHQRAIPAAPWRFTDDTVMAISIVEVLDDHGHIDQDALARLFAEKYARDPYRGYGGTAHDILEALVAREPWRDVSAAVFDGQGSMGNGGAMRAGPIGGYFADDLSAAARNAGLSAEVTHAHREGQAGAIAVAVAAAWAASRRPAADLLRGVLCYVPTGETHAGIARAAALSPADDVASAVSALGNGSRVLAIDTVPFALWCAARHLDNYEEALWTTVAGLGDRDTTCAIVGSIVALAVGDSSIPADWISSREPLEVMSRAGGR